MSTSTTTSTPTAQLIRLRDLTKLYDGSSYKSWLRRHLEGVTGRDGVKYKLRAIRIGRGLRTTRQWVDEWLAAINGTTPEALRLDDPVNREPAQQPAMMSHEEHADREAEAVKAALAK